MCVPRFVSQLPDFSALEVLELPVEEAITSTDITTLSCLPTLETLKCALDGFADFRDGFAAPRLHSLDITGTAPDVTGFFTNIHAPLLRLLGIWVEDPKIPDEVVHLIRTISASSFAAYLRYCQVRMRMDGEAESTEPDSHSHTRLVDVLRPLLSSPAMEKFMLMYRWKTSLSDDDLLEVVQAWPHLEELRLLIPDESTTFPFLTVLPPLLGCCPKLMRIGVPLDITKLSDAIDGGPTETHPLRLFDFHFRHWPQAEVSPADLAEYLGTLIPQLDTSESANSILDSHYSRELLEMLMDMQLQQIRRRVPDGRLSRTTFSL